MRTYRYTTVDVFAETAFAGNPLAVVPEATGLTPEKMQAIAAEFNYSESTFVLPPDDSRHTARVRIFTPKSEVPFAGHPNVGTAFVIASLADREGRSVGPTLVFEELAGLVPVELLRDPDGRLLGATLTAPRPLELSRRIPPDVVARCIGLPESAIVTSRHEPVVASVGLPFVLVEVEPAAIANATPNPAAFERADADYPFDVDRFSVHLYCRAKITGATQVIRARMFAPLSGVFEDPATGSANAALGALLANLDPAPDGELEFIVRQGVEMGRPSRLDVGVRKIGGQIDRVRVGGRCVPIMEGTLSL